MAHLVLLVVHAWFTDKRLNDTASAIFLSQANNGWLYNVPISVLALSAGRLVTNPKEDKKLQPPYRKILAELIYLSIGAVPDSSIGVTMVSVIGDFPYGRRTKIAKFLGRSY